MTLKISHTGEILHDEEISPRDHIQPLLNLMRENPNSGLRTYLERAVSAYTKMLRTEAPKK